MSDRHIPEQFSSDDLEHMSQCTSQYDSTCSALALELLRSRGYERAAEAALAEARQERERLKETLANSEEYRRAYQAGKMALYAMGSPFTEAAMEHFPCGEGALDRRFTKLIEMPRITALQQQVTQQAEELTALRKHSVKQVELVTQQAATIAELQSTLETISDLAPGYGDVCEFIARRARAALASIPKLPVQILEKEK